MPFRPNVFTNSLDYYESGAGETNTAASGGSGTSIYYQKSGVQLQFNALKSENNLLGVSLDAVSHDIEFTVSQTNINAGISIAVSQVTDLDTAGATQDQVLAYNASSGTWTPATVEISDHGALTGLGDDDHSQYLLADGTRTLAGNLFTTGYISTGGETSPDVDTGGICLNHGAGTDSVLTTKSSDITHSFTSLAQTDTYFELRKHVQVDGGALLRGFTEATTGFEFRGYAEATSTGDYATIQLTSYTDNGGTGVAALSDNSNIVGFRNNAVVKHKFKGGGDALFIGGLTLGSFVGTQAAGSTQWSGAVFQAYDGAAWDSMFSCPGSMTDNAIVRFDGTGGYTGQDSGITIDDSNVIAFSSAGEGGMVVHHSAPTSLADDASFTLPDASSGYGFFQAGDGEEYAMISWKSDGTVVIVYGSANTAASDADGNLCFIDGGTQVSVKNRLGSSKEVMFDYHYTT